MIEIRAYEKVSGSPAMPIMARAWLAIGETHQDALESCPIHWEDNAFVAFYAGVAVGVLSWNVQDWNRSAFIKIGWVSPEARKRGVYRALWDALVKRAGELKLRRVEGATPMANAEMRAIAAKLGRYEIHVTMAFDLPVTETA